MGSGHRDNAQFSRAKWRKTILLPCWIFQILILLAMMGLFSYRLSRTSKTWKDQLDQGEDPTVEFIWETAIITFSFISLVIVFVSIARFIAEVLTPLPLLFGNIINLALTSAVLALDIVVYVRYADRAYSLVGLIFDCLLLFFTIIPTFYSFTIYRRLLSYDDYHIPGNVKPYGYASTEDPEETAYRTSWREAPTPYDPTNPYVTVTRPRSMSAVSCRISVALGSQPSSPQTTPPPTTERPMSYDHKRDTKFDEYVQRRSRSYSKADVERALGVEFGWEDTRDQRDSIINSGTISVLQVRARGDSLSTRQGSLQASLSRNTSSSTTTTTTTTSAATSNPSNPTPTLEAQNAMLRAHSLISVPEVHEEDGDFGSIWNMIGSKTGESQETLLGNDEVSRSSSGASRYDRERMEQVEGLEVVQLESGKDERKA
ncbi:uncharacterized protein F4812DRAFT_361495 [Daldinia caldariorum]|uniref:uncharacterized protein n=1 Tax=Daldinia caldariorum TaxID=326644 RepID=UPI00200733DB|nr:uncharacterized protein F4812DRAFT_361495 [Daldinia caldariorum]KAI1468290.1 hypothetical protein F4812DRAFT_361495 [Daldinia caldariorum]